MSRIIARSEWGARAPKARHTIDLPTPKLYLHHSAGSGADGAAVRAIQKFHMDPPPAGRGWNDIAYSFLIDDDPQTPGDVFEGRGAGIAGGHTAGQNTISHGICVVGNFQTRRPRDETLNTLVGLVAHGHRQGWWPDRITGGHRDAPGAATSCPGDTLHRLIPQINSEVQRTSKGDDMTPTQARLEVAAAWYAKAGVWMDGAGTREDPQARLTRLAGEHMRGRSLDDIVRHVGKVRDPQPGEAVPAWVLDPTAPYAAPIYGGSGGADAYARAQVKDLRQKIHQATRG